MSHKVTKTDKAAPALGHSQSVGRGALQVERRSPETEMFVQLQAGLLHRLAVCLCNSAFYLCSDYEITNPLGKFTVSNFEYKLYFFPT